MAVAHEEQGTNVHHAVDPFLGPRGGPPLPGRRVLVDRTFGSEQTEPEDWNEARLQVRLSHPATPAPAVAISESTPSTGKFVPWFVAVSSARVSD